VANGTCFSSEYTVGIESEEKQLPFAALYTRPPDEGLKLSPKHVEAWELNKVKKIVHRVGLLYNYTRCTVNQTLKKVLDSEQFRNIYMRQSTYLIVTGIFFLFSHPYVI
jgi:hypothetical protein